MIDQSHGSDRGASSGPTSVRGLLGRALEGWERGDGQAFAEAFAADGDLILFDGMLTRGRGQIAFVMQRLFNGALKGSRIAASVMDLRFLDPDVALMLTLGGVLLPGETQLPPDRQSIQAWVAARRAGRWQFASVQNTRIRAATDEEAHS
jgi:uncharacterized protein (TIGR02246 family)